MKTVRMLAALTLVTPSAPALAQAFDAAPKLADAEMKDLRGGFTLPGGVQVAIGVAIETSIDGVLALRSVLGGAAPGVVVDSGAGTLTIERGGPNTVARLAAQGTDITQLIGRATATIVANSASDRVIDTTTTVTINLGEQLLHSNFISTLESVTSAVAGR